MLLFWLGINQHPFQQWKPSPLFKVWVTVSKDIENEVVAFKLTKEIWTNRTNEKCLQAAKSTYERGDIGFHCVSRSTQQILLGCSLWSMEPPAFCSNNIAGCTWQLWSTGTGRQSSFPASHTYPKLLMDCGWEATDQRFHINSAASGLWEHHGHFTTDWDQFWTGGWTTSHGQSDDLRDRLCSSHTTAPLRADLYPRLSSSLSASRLVEGMGVWGGRGGRGGRQSQNKPHGSIAFSATHCLHNGEESSLTADNCNMAEKCNCRKSIRAKSIK